MSEEGDVTREHCNRCLQHTKHEVVAVRKQPGRETIRTHAYDQGIEISWSTTYYLLECRGCEEISVKRTYWWSEEPGEEQVEFFPPRVSRRAPEWADELPEATGSLLEEVYTALQADSRRLALMGARAIIDDLLMRQVGDTGTFVQKLDALEEKGFLSQVNRDVLEAALEAGHAAVHRKFVADPENLHRVMDIVENALQAEHLSKSVEELRAATPARDEEA